jgi:hypothetical protein
MIKTNFTKFIFPIFSMLIGILIGHIFWKSKCLTAYDKTIKVKYQEGYLTEPSLEQAFALMLHDSLYFKAQNNKYSNAFLEKEIVQISKKWRDSTLFYILRSDTTGYEILISPGKTFRNGYNYYLLTEKNLYLLDERKILFYDETTKKYTDFPLEKKATKHHF